MVIALYPGKATLGFLGVTNHNYRSIDFTTNGFFVGYRWYDKNNVAPLFPFARLVLYDLEYRNLVLKAEKDGTVRVVSSSRTRAMSPERSCHKCM
jgi:hypothetical protein